MSEREGKKVFSYVFTIPVGSVIPLQSARPDCYASSTLEYVDLFVLRPVYASFAEVPDALDFKRTIIMINENKLH